MRIRGEIKCFYFFNLEPKDIYIYIYNKSIYIINLYKEYIYIYKSGFYPSTFVYSRFSPKIQFLYCLLSSLARWGDLMVDTKIKVFEFYVCRYWKMHFSWILPGILEFYGEF